MKIGIIGTVDAGSALARRLIKDGHEVHVAGLHGTQDMGGLPRDMGDQVPDVSWAVHEAEVVIFALPLPMMLDVPAGLFDQIPPGAAVIDLSELLLDSVQPLRGSP